MKNVSTLIAAAGLLSTMLLSCAKDPCHPEIQTPQPQDQSVQSEAVQTEYKLAAQSNDSLILYHDSLQMCHGNNSLPHDSSFYASMMSHCDFNYHSHDSLMINHHNSMHSSGGMMNGGGMMNEGGMMNGSSGTGNSNHKTCTINNLQYDAAVDSLHNMHLSHH